MKWDVVYYIFNIHIVTDRFSRNILVLTQSYTPKYMQVSGRIEHKKKFFVDYIFLETPTGMLLLVFKVEAALLLAISALHTAQTGSLDASSVIYGRRGRGRGHFP